MNQGIINGFSGLTQDEKLRFVVNLLSSSDEKEQLFNGSLFRDIKMRNNFLDLSENTIGAYHMPYSIAPNLMVDGDVYHVPMVTEESSVVAAAAWSAKFWAERGGFKVDSLSTSKFGHVYFLWKENPLDLTGNWPYLRFLLLERVKTQTTRMEGRGGGIVAVELENLTYSIPNLFRINVEFETVDSMGANFINSCLEEIAQELKLYYAKNFSDIGESSMEGIMAILSNYADGCMITVSASCSVLQLDGVVKGLSGAELARKIKLAYDIALVDVYRATTHNKGIMNGVDAVLIATGNDFRAVEAGAHAFASATGRYRSLSECSLSNDIFTIKLTMPLALGTVGGVINIHPMAKASLELLGNPTAKDLMKIVAAVGLASNFSAVKSLVTNGIQQGHMKMHLSNILVSLGADPKTKAEAILYFEDKKVSFAAVKEFLTGKQ
ncbi:hydroxymethylglutaryl-CoA reductase, degradative [Williamwhitmania taraxaci]|uniref:3-hydroxy-3-methylglutaryl coenzyme A reductase n=1 Tax=Williamwhitmania taraxaci TaxID=1640674 RepID=A0A1G6H5A0_9BACT|nr:hydroxymethylglutaryl-CoA reductase, degradative [Williamwhitmania taraxaci]SDB89333.1 3-hydroxy-3-methylglutaryl-coenzyme A reductase [Williamwhitmania taraxaci]